MQEIPVPIPGYGTAAARAALPIVISVRQSSATHCYQCLPEQRYPLLSVSARAALPIVIKVCSIFVCPNRACHCQCLGLLTHAQLLMHASCESTWGLCWHCKSLHWEKNPLLHQRLEPVSALHLIFQSDTLLSYPCPTTTMWNQWRFCMKVVLPNHLSQWAHNETLLSQPLEPRWLLRYY